MNTQRSVDRTTVFAALAVTTGLYAVLLEKTRPHWKPGLTWLTVVIGVVICVVFARAATPDDATVDESHATLRAAFIVGGVPVILWRVLRSARFGFG